MKRTITMALLLVVAMTATAFAQRRASKPSFGSLLYDAKLQKQLKMTEEQVLIMQSLYLRSIRPGDALFRAFVMKKLKITRAQRREMQDVKRELLKGLKKLSDDPEKLDAKTKSKRYNDLRKTEGVAMLKILTKEQRKVYKVMLDGPKKGAKKPDV